MNTATLEMVEHRKVSAKYAANRAAFLLAKGAQVQRQGLNETYTYADGVTCKIDFHSPQLRIITSFIPPHKTA